MEKLYGYNGTSVYIDLSNREIDIKDINPKDAEKYIGGCGLSSKLIFDLLTEEDYNTLKNNPLDKINPIVFATGPITATSRPSSGRYSISAISPLTGIWGEATSGGFFPASLKKSGFDTITITGKSDSSVYIYIREKNIEIKDASQIWGLNTYETQEKIKKEIGDNRVRISCIGKAGEKLVKYACVINDNGRAAGRCGMGAVLGSKNVKALAIVGSEKIEIKDNEKLRECVSRAKKIVRQTFYTRFLEQFGTLLYMDMGQIFGDTPAFYFTDSDFLSTHLTGRALKEQFPVVSASCVGCTIGCGRKTYLESNGDEIEIDGPEYETTATYGPLCGVTTMEQILKMNHLSNQEGIDTISAGVSIAFLIYLVENKIALEEIGKHLNSINLSEIKWGNAALVYRLIEKIIKREGIGNLLAEGTKAMARELNVEPGLAAHVKGLEIPMHDPRAFVAQGLCYMTNSRGASHKKGDYYEVDNDAVSYPSLRIKRKERFTMKRKERSIINVQDLRAIDDSAIRCNFVHLPFPLTVEIFNAITGFNYNLKSLLKCGERINNLKRLISWKLGITRKDDYLPKIITHPLDHGPTKGISLQLEDNLRNYYRIRKWDWESGRPNQEKLSELGIELN